MSRLTPALVVLILAGCGPSTIDELFDLGGHASASPIDSGSRPDSGSGLTNDVGCPTTWLDARRLCSAGLACEGFGPACAYANAGDQLPDGSFATAVLFCMDLSGTGAGPGEWRCAQ